MASGCFDDDYDRRFRIRKASLDAANEVNKGHKFMTEFNKAAMVDLADEHWKSGELGKARRVYQSVNEHDPGDLDVIGKELVCSIHLCHWQRYDYLQRIIRDNFRHKGGFLVGEPLLASPYFTAADLREVGRRHMEKLSIRETASGRRQRAAGCTRERLRVGFLGADFYNQATLHLMIGLIEEHDRDRFEYIAYDSGLPQADDPIRRRAIGAFDRFRCVQNLSDDELAHTIERDAIDILIFIRNLTDPRVNVLARRPARACQNFSVTRS